MNHMTAATALAGRNACPYIIFSVEEQVQCFPDRTNADELATAAADVGCIQVRRWRQAPRKPHLRRFAVDHLVGLLDAFPHERRAQRGMARRPDSTPTLAAIACPALVVVGEGDGLTPPAEAEKLAAGIKGAKLVKIPGAGHLPCIEAPEPFTKALAGFFGALPA